MTLPTKHPKALRLRIAHCSLQFSDSENKKKYDLEKLFSRGYDQIGGTEAGPGAGASQRLLKAAARKYGYKIVLSDKYGTWLAVRKTGYVFGSFKSGHEHALDNSGVLKTPGKFGAKGVVWGVWNSGKTYGKFAQGVVHYTNTSGSGGAAKKKAFDTKYARVLKAWRDRRVRYGSLVFMTGDMNRNDRTNDVFMGTGGWITCWDEMKVYPHTSDGEHGSIDVIARQTGTSRAKCVGARHWNDNGIFMNTDHYIIEATYDIMPLPTKKKVKK